MTAVQEKLLRRKRALRKCARSRTAAFSRLTHAALVALLFLLGGEGLAMDGVDLGLGDIELFLQEVGHDDGSQAEDGQGAHDDAEAEEEGAELDEGARREIDRDLH